MVKLIKVTRSGDIVWNGNSLSCLMKFEFSSGHIIDRDYVFLFSNFDRLTNIEILDFYKKNPDRLNTIITNVKHYKVVRSNLITFNTIDIIRINKNQYSIPIVSIGIVSIF
jgi:hypothetical protein